jgi:hypothetical protein
MPDCQQPVTLCISKCFSAKALQSITPVYHKVCMLPAFIGAVGAQAKLMERATANVAASSRQLLLERILQFKVANAMAGAERTPMPCYGTTVCAYTASCCRL